MGVVRGRILVLSILAALVFAIAGCGDDDDGGSTVKDAETVDASKAEGASGNVSWCIGKDTSGSFKEIVDAHNRDSQVKVKLLELPTSADEQRTQQVQRLRAKNSECDILGMDVIWTAEYAGQGWLYDVSSLVEKRQGDFIPSTAETAKLDDKYFAVPFNANAGFIYYRKSQAQQAPTSWEDMYSKAKDEDGVIYQGMRYEGLTVNFLELLYSAGGKVISDDGKNSEINSQEAQKVLQFMVDGIKNGSVPKAVLTYDEQKTRTAFEANKGTYMRNWPYAYALAKESSIANDFDITNFPSFGGAKGAGVVGGYNLGISTYSKNPDGAVEFIDYATSPESQKLMMTKSTLPSVLTQTYSDADVKKAFPFAPNLLKAIQQAKARPVTPVYPQVTEAIYKNVYDALSGDTSPDAALKQADDDIKKALETF
jgi:multiple sugar transport system substrate-binding protein